MTEADSQDERGGERERSTPCGLLAAAAAGSNAALEHLLPAIETQLLLRIRLMMGRAARRVADSHDFLAGVMHDLVEQARGGRMPGRAEDLVRWASAIARNNIRDSARKQHEIRLADLTSTVCGVPERQDGAPSPAEQVEFDEQTERLVDAMTGLKDEDRMVIELRDLEALSYREVAERLGEVSESSARRRHAKALAQLSRLCL